MKTFITIDPGQFGQPKSKPDLFADSPPSTPPQPKQGRTPELQAMIAAVVKQEQKNPHPPSNATSLLERRITAAKRLSADKPSKVCPSPLKSAMKQTPKLQESED